MNFPMGRPTRVAVLALGMVHAAVAMCPNSCSGHGTCGPNFVCECYIGWVYGDCPERTCPHEVIPKSQCCRLQIESLTLSLNLSQLAFVDQPDVDGTFHNYRECSGKGVCDRENGECQCFDGWTGKGCQRAVCPNDCSGHGRCEFIQDLPMGSVPGDYWYGIDPAASGLFTSLKTFDSPDIVGWDYNKNVGCLCDPGYTEADCSRRLCPRGNDVNDIRIDPTDVVKYHIQNVTLFSGGTSGNGSASAISDFYDRTFALTFTSKLNETYTTIPIKIDSSVGSGTVTEIEDYLASDIEIALEALPNQVIDNVNVNVSFGYLERTMGGGFTSTIDDLASLMFEIEFVGMTVTGRQNLLAVETKECLYGCSPQLTGLHLLVYTDDYATNQLSFVTEKQQPDYNNYECGRRGSCDYTSGICNCFEGFTGESCSLAVAMV